MAPSSRTPASLLGESKQVSLWQRCLFVCLCAAECRCLHYARGRAEILPAIRAHACGCGTGVGVRVGGLGRVIKSIKFKVQSKPLLAHCK